jgi:hypothetical protein
MAYQPVSNNNSIVSFYYKLLRESLRIFPNSNEHYAKNCLIQITSSRFVYKQVDMEPRIATFVSMIPGNWVAKLD